MTSEAERLGWKAIVRPVEVGCWGFIATSTIRLLRDLGIHRQALCQIITTRSQTVEHYSQWLWIRRKDPNPARSVRDMHPGLINL